MYFIKYLKLEQMSTMYFLSFMCQLFIFTSWKTNFQPCVFSTEKVYTLIQTIKLILKEHNTKKCIRRKIHVENHKLWTGKLLVVKLIFDAMLTAHELSNEQNIIM